MNPLSIRSGYPLPPVWQFAPEKRWDWKTISFPLWDSVTSQGLFVLNYQILRTLEGLVLQGFMLQGLQDRAPKKILTSTLTSPKHPQTIISPGVTYETRLWKRVFLHEFVCAFFLFGILYWECFRVVDLALNQSQTLVSPIFRSLPSVADCFRHCITGTNLYGRNTSNRQIVDVAIEWARDNALECLHWTWWPIALQQCVPPHPETSDRCIRTQATDRWCFPDWLADYWHNAAKLFAYCWWPKSCTTLYEKGFPRTPWMLTLQLLKSRKCKQFWMAEILHHLGCQPNFEIMGVAGGSIKDARLAPACLRSTWQTFGSRQPYSCYTPSCSTVTHTRVAPRKTQSAEPWKIRP